MGKSAKKGVILLLFIAVILFIAAFAAVNTSELAALGAYNYSDKVFVIKSQSDFDAFLTLATTSKGTFPNKTVKLFCDVDASGFYMSGFDGVWLGYGHSFFNVDSNPFETIGGTVSDINVYFGGSANAFVKNNNGIIENVGFFGTLKASNGANYAAPVYDNKGTVINCVNGATITSSINNSTYAGISVSNSGTIENCAFVGSFNCGIYINAASGIVVNQVITDDGITAANVGTVKNCAVAADFYGAESGRYAKLGNCNVSENNFVAIRDGDGNAEITDNGHTYALNGEGVESDPYIIESLKDLFRIKYVGLITPEGGAPVYYALNADLDMTGIGVIPTVEGFDYRGGVMRGEFGFVNADGATIFDIGYGIRGENVGFLNSRAESVCNLTTDVNEHTYDFGGEIGREAVTVTASESLTGSGTEKDPYIINTVSDLAALGEDTLVSRGAFAVLNRDIAINSHYFNYIYELPLILADVDFNGNGHTIIGLFTSLFDNNSGKIYNLKLRGYRADTLLCAANYGDIENVATFGTVVNAGLIDQNVMGTVADCVNYACGAVNSENIPYTTYAFCRENSRSAESITRCENYGAVAYAFPINKGARDCINYGEVGVSAADALDVCVDEFNGVVYADGKAHEARSENLNRYDVRGAFGYPIGGSVAELKKREEEYYMQVLKKPYNTDFTLDFDEYSEGNFYDRDGFESQLITAETMDGSEFTWTFAKWGGEASEFTGEQIKNAGIYTVTARFAGNDYYFPAEATVKIEIAKAAAPLEMTFENFTAAKLQYNGERQTAASITPSNIDALGEYGYGEVESRLFDGERETEFLVDAGTYSQEISLSSDNYETIAARRSVIVEKKPLTVKLSSLSCNYNEAIDLRRVIFTYDGLVASDKGKSATELFGEYALTTDYETGETGADVGVNKYYIELTASAKNYEVTAERGYITVKAVDIPMNGISFYGAEPGIDGAESREYTGEIIFLTATVPEWISVEYVGNTNKDVTEGATVQAVLSQKVKEGEAKNYNDVTLKAVLTITPAPLTLKANDGRSAYGDKLNYGNYSLIGVKCDDEAELRSALTVNIKLFDGETEVTESAPKVKGYTLKATATGELKNYSLTVENGVYTVDKAPLYRIFKNNVAGNATDFDNKTVIYDGNEVERRLPEVFYDDTLYDVVTTVKYDGKEHTGSIVNSGTYEIKAVVTPKGAEAENYKETEYACTVIVEKKQLTISFTEESYEKTYSSENKAKIESYEFSGDYGIADVDPLLTCFNLSNEALESAIDVGEYILKVTVAESKNYKEAVATAKLTITPKALTVNFEREYVYTGSAVTPKVKGEIGGVYNNEIGEGDFIYSIYGVTDTELTTPIDAINAMSYVFTASVDSENYTLNDVAYPMVIKPMAIEIELGTLEIVYGTIGDAKINGNVYYVSRSGEGLILTRRDIHPLISTVSFVVPSINVSGEGYELTDESVITMGNVTVTFKEGTVNKVVITRRPLGVVWTMDGRERENLNIEIAYAGYSQNYRFGFNVIGLAAWDEAEKLNLTMKLSGDGQEIFHVGNYEYNADLRDSINYYLDIYPLKIRVNKAPLYISVSDMEMPYGDRFVRGKLELGMKTAQGVAGAPLGLDKDKSASDLTGASISYQTAYSEASAIGTRHTLNVTATFKNYDATVIKTGEILVVPNSYPDYRLKDAYIVYDGREHTVELENVLNGVNVVYTPTNVFKNAGNYILSAIVTYPTGRQISTSCRVYVKKATPVVEVKPMQTLYATNKALTDDMLDGNAHYENDENNKIPGKLVFSKADGRAPTLARGDYFYDWTFTPEDTDNYETVEGKVRIASDEILFGSLVISDGVVSYDNATSTLVINKEVRIKLPESVLTGLKLYRDGYEVEEIIMSKTEELELSVKLEEETALLMRLKVVFATGTSENPQEISVSAFAFVNARLSGDTLYVKEGGGYLALAENYKDRYNLKVNGNSVGQYRITGEEGRISVVIELKSTGTPINGGWWFNVVTETTENEPKITNKTLYIIIGCSVGGVALIIALVLLIWKKKNG